jgi:hypothetical protein
MNQELTSNAPSTGAATNVNRREKKRHAKRWLI